MSKNIKLYLPFNDAKKCWITLEDKHLIQSREGLVRIVECLAEQSVTLPRRVMRMWQGFAPFAAWLGVECCKECQRRQIPMRASMRKFRNVLDANNGKYEIPPWWGDNKLHYAHQTLLKSRLPRIYASKTWTDGNRRWRIAIKTEYPMHWPRVPEPKPVAESIEELMEMGWNFMVLYSQEESLYTCKFWQGPVYEGQDFLEIRRRTPKGAIEAGFKHVVNELTRPAMVETN